jgi:hypothetical protein
MAKSLQLSLWNANTVLALVHTQQPSSEPHGAIRQQAIAKTTAKWSAYQILSVIVTFVITFF